MMPLPYHQVVRTTLTLDDDTVAQVRAEMQRRGHSFKRALNDLIRRGATATHPQKIKRFRVRAQPLGLPKDLSYDHVEELLDRLDGPARR